MPRPNLALFRLLSHSLSAQITTEQYGNERTGVNLNGITLIPSNVRAKTFGKLFTLKVDGDVYAQLLAAPANPWKRQGVRRS